MAVRCELAQEYIRLNQLWTHDWILNLLAALHGGPYYCRESLLFYRLHGSNVIGMAQGEHAQRQSLHPQSPYALALAFKYSFLEATQRPAAGAHQVFPLATYESVFEKTACKETEQRQRDTWKTRQAPARLIEQRKHFSYLVLPDACARSSRTSPTSPPLSSSPSA